MTRLLSHLIFNWLVLIHVWTFTAVYRKYCVVCSHDLHTLAGCQVSTTTRTASVRWSEVRDNTDNRCARWNSRCLFFFRWIPLPFAALFFRWISLFFAARFFRWISLLFAAPFFRWISLLFAVLFFAAFRCPFPSLNSAVCFFRWPLFSLPFTAAHFYYFSLLTLSAASLVGLKCHNLSLLQLYKGMFLMPFSSAITNWITLMFRLFSLRH